MARPDARRPHQSLGPHLAPLRPRRLQGEGQDGLGDNWPISYNDIKPYYDEVDDLVGIFGSKEGLRNHPDGNFLPAPKPRCWETVVKRAADKHKVTCIPSRLSILTKPKNGRPACHYCGQCNRGCVTNSNFTSPNVLLFPAMQSGLLTIRTDAMVREVSVNRDGLADGVIFIDKLTGNGREGRGEGGGARRVGVRDRAHHAELEVDQVSAGDRQLERDGRQVPHRHHRHRRRRLRARR